MDDIQFSLILAANPLSDCKAAVQIYKTIRQIDIHSKSIRITIPGFHVNNYKKKDSDSVIKAFISRILKHNIEYHNDYHGQEAIYHTYCNSVGDVYFNDADFSQFMLDLEGRCSSFNYLGRTQLVVVPTKEGHVLYNKVKSFFLQPFFESWQNHSLEEFLLSVFNLLLSGENRTTYACIDDIDALYKKLTGKTEDDASVVSIRIDNTLLKHLNWQELSETFFISYSTKDEYDAFKLKILLEKYGKKVWIAPDGIPTGVDYAQAIPAALRIVSRFVVLLSHNSANSAWVRREIDRAISNNKRIDGIFLDDFDMNNVCEYDHLSFLLCNTQLRYHINDLYNQGEMFKKFLNL